jgi:hypothetical protein
MALAAILSWYFGIGVLAAIGTVTISRARFSPRFEHIFFALLLIPIAAMYLAFVEYFGDHSALRLEVYGVALFAGLGLLGLRLPVLLIIGYALHGVWDLAHEAFLNFGPAPGDIRSVTVIPLAYGVFCGIRLVRGGILPHQTGRVAALSSDRLRLESQRAPRILPSPLE